jgi:hypothetical protein
LRPISAVSARSCHIPRNAPNAQVKKKVPRGIRRQ